MDFDSGVNGEAQALIGDSGGGLFHKRTDGMWELTGILDAISTFNGQPGQTAVYGNATVAIDIATYQAQIAAIIPEPASGAMLVLGFSAIFLGIRRNRE
jgi:hypothetical protein